MTPSTITITGLMLNTFVRNPQLITTISVTGSMIYSCSSFLLVCLIQVRATSILENLKRIKEDIAKNGVASATTSSHTGARPTDGTLINAWCMLHGEFIVVSVNLINTY
jgi:hypothetical protein